jgi:transposase, IS5 family
MQGNMASPRKKRTQVPEYVSPNQLKLEGFESPFDQKLSPTNRWVVLAHLIPWDEICNMYFKFVPKGQTGRPALNPRIVIGSLIIKHMCNLDDRETVDQISENIYMQYFLGYPSFTNESPFDASLFVEFRKRLGMDNLNAINEKIVALKTKLESPHKPDNRISDSENENEQSNNQQDNTNDTEPKGRVIYDATACPQDIAYPTDLNLLNDAREKLEELIDLIYNKELHEVKPRTYREVARKTYLQTAQKKNKSRKVIRKANRSQLNYVRRDIAIVNELLDGYKANNLKFPLNPSQQNYLFVVQTLYDQQKQMYDSNTHSVEHRIVSIHQPHVRPIVRGKAQAKVEFGSKIHVSIINGISFLDELSWDAFNEGSHMMDYIEKYRKRFGCYPREVLADQIYCTRVNRAALKELGIKLLAKPLGRPSAMTIHVSPGERNPIEGKFGQAKTAYGLDRIKARLKGTSESWIATIVLVLNLVKLAGVVLLYTIPNFYQRFSARLLKTYLRNLLTFAKQISFIKQTDDSRQILYLDVG